MKIIGMIGGTTWHSTVEYYRIVNEEVARRLGGSNSAKCILHSVNFAEVQEMNKEPDLKSLTALLTNAAKNLQISGAEGLMLCANSLHVMAERVQQTIDIPIIHIGDATALKIKEKGFRKVGLLGTKITMEQDFIKAKLRIHEIETLVPELSTRNFIHHVIMNELSRGIFLDSTKLRFMQIIESLISVGAEGIILGCTEIPLIIKQEDCAVPVFDTLLIHAQAGVDFSLGKS